MDIHVSGRGVEIPLALRRRVEIRVAKVARVLPKITEVRVALERERYRHLARVTLQVKGATLHGEGVGADFHEALDLAMVDVETQARRRKDRIRARKPRPSRRARPQPAGGPGGVTEAPPEEPEVVVRRLAAKPMSVDEALEEMRTRADGVLVFTNARSRVLNVLRRRADGRLELVQPAG